jgi:hypothetical protein
MLCPAPTSAGGAASRPGSERSSPGERHAGAPAGPLIKLIDFGLSVFCDGG